MFFLPKVRITWYSICLVSQSNVFLNNSRNLPYCLLNCSVVEEQKYSHFFGCSHFFWMRFTIGCSRISSYIIFPALTILHYCLSFDDNWWCIWCLDDFVFLLFEILLYMYENKYQNCGNFFPEFRVKYGECDTFISSQFRNFLTIITTLLSNYNKPRQEDYSKR